MWFVPLDHATGHWVCTCRTISVGGVSQGRGGVHLYWVCRTISVGGVSQGRGGVHLYWVCNQ